MKISPIDRFNMTVRAFAGSRHARDLHRYYLQNATSINDGLNVIRTRWPRLCGKSGSSPIFIFSAGWRSGSTFLQRMVLSGDDVFVWGEPFNHAGAIDSMARQIEAFTDKWPFDRFFVHSMDDGHLTHQWVANLYPSMQSYMDAHIAYFEALFSQPAEARAKRRWGVKEVTLTVDHARYLKWLFPAAKFVFLIRNPYHAYRSFRHWGCWYRRWPGQPVFTATAFGRLWTQLAEDFQQHHTDVDGLLVRYEDLHDESTVRRLRQYLDVDIKDPDTLPRLDGASKSRRSDIPKLERWLLSKEVKVTAPSVGYST